MLSEVTMRWLAVLASVFLAAPAAAQDWPNRNIRVVVPYPAGGPADFMGRLAAQKLGEKLGVSVVVENRSGASGTIGAETVRQSPPDGYTFLAAPVVHVLGRLVVKAVPYDPVGDFTAIVRYGEGPLIVLANPAAVPGKTLADALPAIRSKPDDFRFGVSALGSPTVMSSAAATASARVATGGFHTCNLANRRVRCWGYNSNGQLGIG
ncbi:MAG: hypothetical protein DI543_09650, partial [Bradyrhizobium icense]